MANTHSLDLESTSSQYASITDASQTGLDLTGDMTVEAWVKLESAPGLNATYAIARKYDETGNNRSYMYRYQDVGGTKRFEVRFSSDGTGANTSIGTLNYTLSAGIWYHLAFVYDASAGTCVVYVNGASQGTISSMKTSVYNGASTFNIGGSSGDADYFDGLIDDVRVWSDIRTQEEIVNNAGKELVGNEANLVGYWKFNNNYEDTTANNNDLTASGSPVFSTTVAFTEATDVSTHATLPTSLVSYYSLDDIEDATANNRDLTNNNTVTFDTGKIDNGADFGSSNTNKSLSVADTNVALGKDVAQSVAFWVNVTTAPTTGNTAYLFFNDGSDGNRRVAYGNSGGTLQLNLARGSSSFLDNTAFNYTLTTSTWFHVVMTYAGTGTGLQELYVNGILVGTQTSTNTAGVGVATPTFAWAIRKEDDSLPFSGKIDEGGVWGKVLEYGEILQLYNAGSGIPYESAVAATDNAISFANNF